MAGYYSNLDGTTENIFRLKYNDTFIALEGTYGTSGYYDASGISQTVNVGVLNLGATSLDDETIPETQFNARSIGCSRFFTTAITLGDVYQDSNGLRIGYHPSENVGIGLLELAEIPSGVGQYVPKLNEGLITWVPDTSNTGGSVITHQITPLVGATTVTIPNFGANYSLVEIHYGNGVSWTVAGTRTIKVGVTGDLAKFAPTVTSTSNSTNYTVTNLNFSPLTNGTDPVLITYTNSGSTGGSMRVRLVWNKVTSITP